MSLSKQQRFSIVWLLLVLAVSAIWGIDRFAELKNKRQIWAEATYQAELSTCQPTSGLAAYQACFDHASARFTSNQKVGWTQLQSGLLKPLLQLWMVAWLAFKVFQWIVRGT